MHPTMNEADIPINARLLDSTQSPTIAPNMRLQQMELKPTRADQLITLSENKLAKSNLMRRQNHPDSTELRFPREGYA